jgi:hypothetical protein
LTKNIKDWYRIQIIKTIVRILKRFTRRKFRKMTVTQMTRMMRTLIGKALMKETPALMDVLKTSTKQFYKCEIK